MRIAMAVPTLLLVAFSRPQDSGRVYQAPDPEPTPEETLALEHMNAMRANPAPFAERIAAYAKTDSTGQWNLVDWKMFMDEIRALKPAPPLVFNLDLLDAARKHSHYITLNDQLGHDETPSKPGFTGARPADRVAAAGYAGLFSAENAGTGHRNGWDSHCRFIIDAGPGGTGGMQPERGHRRNMMSPGTAKSVWAWSPTAAARTPRRTTSAAGTRGWPAASSSWTGTATPSTTWAKGSARSPSPRATAPRP
jgi:uncharacterized protein YkwD